jgi:hypothetical protein
VQHQLPLPRHITASFNASRQLLRYSVKRISKASSPIQWNLDLSFPDPSFNFCSPWTNPIQTIGPASIVFSYPLFFFITPDENDESRCRQHYSLQLHNSLSSGSTIREPPHPKNYPRPHKAIRWAQCGTSQQIIELVLNGAQLKIIRIIMYLFTKNGVRTANGTSWILFLMYGAGVERSPLSLRPLIGLLYQPWMTDGDDCGAISGWMSGKGNRSTRRKPATIPICPS